MERRNVSHVFEKLEDLRKKYQSMYLEIRNKYESKIIPNYLREATRSLMITNDLFQFIEWYSDSKREKPFLSRYARECPEFKGALAQKRKEIKMKTLKDIANICYYALTDTIDVGQAYLDEKWDKCKESVPHTALMWLQVYQKDHREGESWYEICDDGKFCLTAKVKLWGDSDLDNLEFEAWAGTTDDYKKSQTKKWIVSHHNRLGNLIGPSSKDKGKIQCLQSKSKYYSNKDASVIFYYFPSELWVAFKDRILNDIK